MWRRLGVAPPTTIVSQGLYFECKGHGGCGRVICDLCQQIRVHEFEGRPQLMVHKLGVERELAEIISSLEAETKAKQAAAS